MPGKMARSAPDHRSGCPMRWWPSIPRVWLAGRPEKREYSRLFGSHLGNPSSNANSFGVHSACIGALLDPRQIVAPQHFSQILCPDALQTFEKSRLGRK